MIYKICMMSGQEIVVENEEALNSLLKEANEGKKLILTKYGIVNVASIDSIIEHKEKMEEIRESLRFGKSLKHAESDALPSSPFAKLLAPKMKMLEEDLGEDDI